MADGVKAGDEIRTRDFNLGKKGVEFRVRARAQNGISAHLHCCLASFCARPGSASVHTAGGNRPPAFLTGDLSDTIEVGVVVQHDEIHGLRSRSHEQVGYLASALTARCQMPLDLKRPSNVGGCCLDELK